MLGLALAIAALAGASASPAAAATDSLWTQVQDLSAKANDGEVPQVAIADDGSALAVWLVDDPAVQKKRVQFAARKQGENFVVPGPRGPNETEAEHIARVEPTFLSAPARAAKPHIRLKMNKAGDAIVVWEADDGSVRSAYKPAGGNFGAEQVVTGGAAATPEVGIDGQGAATVIFRGTGTRASSIYESRSRPPGAAATWGDAKSLIAHPTGFGKPEIPTSYVEVRGSLAVDEEGNRSAVFSSDADPDYDPANPPPGGADSTQKVFEVTSGAGATDWTVQNEEYSGNTQPYSTHALRSPSRHLAGWDWGNELDAVSSPGNPTGVADKPSGSLSGPTSTSGSAFALDESGLALWSTGSLLHASYVQNNLNFDPEPDPDPIARNAGATRTRPMLAKDGNGSILSVFEQKRDNEQTVQVALRPPGGGTQFDAPMTVRGADGTERSGAPVALSEPCDLSGAGNCDLESDQPGKVGTGPTVAMNSGGEAVAAWSQGDGSVNSRVKVSLYIPRPAPGQSPIPIPPPPPPAPEPSVPSLIQLARPVGRGEATVLTLKSGTPGAQTTSDGAKKLDWGFGTKNEPPVTGEVTNGALERSVRLRLPDRSFTARVQAQTPNGLRTFTRSFTMPSLPDTGDAGKVVDALKPLKTPPVFAVGATDTLTAQSKSCSPMKVWSGEQKMSGCFKPIEQLGDIPSPEKGAVHELGNQLKLDETSTALMGKATQLTDGYVANGKALLNDKFPVTPSQAASIVSIPQAQSLISAKAELPVGGATYDPKNGFNLKLDPKKVKIPLGKLPKPPKLPSIGGLEIVGDWDVDLEKREAKIKASVVLPKEITKAGLKLSNEVKLRATPDRVIVDSARVGPADANIGALNVADFKIEYKREPDEWTGQARACVVSGACLDVAPPNGHITIKHGDVTFAGASLIFPVPGVPLFPGINLERVGFGIGFDPTRLIGSGRIGAVRLIAVDGRLVTAFPSARTPFILRRDEVGNDFPADLYGASFTRPTIGLTGGVALKVPELDDIKFGFGHVLYEYPGYISAGGGIDLNLIEIVQLRGSVAGQFDIPGELFNVHGDIESCLFNEVCGKAVANVSHGPNKAGGAGACISALGVSVGGGVQWARLSDPFIWPFDGCKWSRFKLDVRPSSARSANAHTAAAGYPVDVKSGAPSPAIQLFGQGGAPRVRVRGPGGQLLDGNSDKNLDLSPGGKIRILRFDGNKFSGPSTVVGLQNAQPGRYTIEALPGSPAISKVARATDQPDAKVTGRVTGKGRRRVLHYDVRGREGQKVLFQEIEPSGVSKTIGTTTKGGRGKIRFTSAPGGGVRRVVAQFSLSEMPAERKLVTTFKPQSIHLAAPKGVRVRHRGNRLLVSWRRVPGAARYEVAASLSGRRMAFATTRGRKVAVKRVWPWLGGRVRVRALDSMRQSTPARGRRFRATGLRPSPFRTLFTCRVGARKIACGPPRSSCLAQRLAVAGRRIGPARLGANGLALLRRYPPVSRRAGAAALCVRGGGQVWVGSTNGPIDLIATTASGHRTRQAGPGRLRRAEITGARRLAPGLLVGHRVGNGRLIYGVRGRSVRFLAVVTLRQLKHPRAVSRRLRSLGLG